MAPRQGCRTRRNVVDRAGANQCPRRQSHVGRWGLRLNCLEQSFLDLGYANFSNDVCKETVNHQAASLSLVDAPAAEVEQLLVVEAASCRRVAGTFDLPSLDLEVGHRVGATTVGEYQVLVGLVALMPCVTFRIRTSPIQTVCAPCPRQARRGSPYCCACAGVVVDEQLLEMARLASAKYRPNSSASRRDPRSRPRRRSRPGHRRGSRAPAGNPRRGQRGHVGVRDGRHRRPSPVPRPASGDAPSPTMISAFPAGC